MKIYQATAAGKKHQSVHEPNQDWCKAKSLYNEFSVGVVLDGVSSVSHAERGAAVGGSVFFDSVSDALQKYSTEAQHIDDADMQRILHRAGRDAVHAIYQCAELYGEKPYAATLHGVIFHEPSHTAWTLHAGDGAVIALKTDGTFVSTSTEQHSGSFPGAVIPLTAGEQYWEYIKFEHVKTVILTTDGVLPLLQPKLLTRYGDLIVYPQAVLPLVDTRAYTEQKSVQNYLDSLVQQNPDYPAYRRYMSRLLMQCGSFSADQVDDILNDMERGDFSYLLEMGRDDRTLVVMTAEDVPYAPYPKSYLCEPDWEALDAERMKKLYEH